MPKSTPSADYVRAVKDDWAKAVKPKDRKMIINIELGPQRFPDAVEVAEILDVKDDGTITLKLAPRVIPCI
jgi:hypothetical protein